MLMEKKTKRFFLWSYIGIFIIVILNTILIIHNNHMDRLFLVMEKEVEESALKCYYEDKCSKNIKVQELYDKSYLEQMVNPRNKEYLNPDSLVTINNDEATLKITK